MSSYFPWDCSGNPSLLCDRSDGLTVVCCRLVSGKCDDSQLKALTCRCWGEARGRLAPAQSKQESALAVWTGLHHIEQKKKFRLAHTRLESPTSSTTFIRHTSYDAYTRSDCVMHHCKDPLWVTCVYLTCTIWTHTHTHNLHYNTSSQSSDV